MDSGGMDKSGIRCEDIFADNFASLRSVCVNPLAYAELFQGLDLPVSNSLFYYTPSNSSSTYRLYIRFRAQAIGVDARYVLYHFSIVTTLRPRLRYSTDI